MANGIDNKSTRTDLAPEFDPAKDCEAQGGIWTGSRCLLPGTKEYTDYKNRQKVEEETGVSLDIPQKQPEEPKDKPEPTPTQDPILQIAREKGLTIAQAADVYASQQAQSPAKQGARLSTQAQNIEQARYEQLVEGQKLQSQVGQVNQLPVEPTGLDVGEALTTGVIGAIPRALGLAVTGAGAGLAGGAAVGSIIPGAGTAAGAGIGAAIGAAGGFVSGIAGSMISNFKSQRTDTVNAQKRVLDEGKQNLNDWATLAATDPVNRATYIKNFNQQLALIDQAYRQMKLDTSRDVAKFETALPDLAEFEAFYAAEGERDFLTARMNQALLTTQDTDYIYQLQELAQRRTT